MNEKHCCDCLDFVQKSVKEQIEIKHEIELELFMTTKTFQRFCPAWFFVGFWRWCLLYPNLEIVFAPFYSTFRYRSLQEILLLSIHWTNWRCVAYFIDVWPFEHQRSLNFLRWSRRVVLKIALFDVATQQIKFEFCRNYSFIAMFN